MKVLFLSFLLACSIKMAKASTDFVQILTEDERAQVLQLLDVRCADTWCEGRFDFKFKSFFCDENTATCRLNFKVLDRGFIPGKYGPKYSTCVFKNIKSAEQILDGDQLSEHFLRELDECILFSTKEFN